MAGIVDRLTPKAAHDLIAIGYGGGSGMSTTGNGNGIGSFVATSIEHQGDGSINFRVAGDGKGYGPRGSFTGDGGPGR